ncbi:MAG: DUF2779 domain-containing protein [Bacteroidales bacterium]|nr:DUF2779 domain-containing protein [Bacteroidales bacterium]
MERHILSKSTFMRGVQCLKALYLHKKRPFLRDKLSQEQKAKFSRGINVGVIARDLFPGGIDVSPKTPFQYPQSVAKTNEEINAGQPIIYEAAFQYNKVLVALDILVYADGKWQGYEVKSSLKVSSTYIMDASLQYYVITNAGIPLENIHVIHLNPDYVLDDQLDVNRFFVTRNVTEEALQNQSFIEEKINEELTITKYKHSPKIDIGLQCHDPYPCDFISHCWKHVPAESIFNLEAFTREELFDMYNSGIIYISDIPTKNIDTPLKRLQVQAHLEQKEYFDSDGIKDFLGRIKYPVTLGKMLVMKSAVPQYKGTRPYEAIPFYFQGHELTREGNITRTTEHYSQTGETPDDFAVRLLNELDKAGTILFYNMSDELQALQFIKRQYPQLSTTVNDIMVKCMDLKHLLDQLLFYNPTLGSKPAYEELSEFFGLNEEYHNLAIQSDIMAGVGYTGLFNETDNEKHHEFYENIYSYSQFSVQLLKLFLNYLQSKE